MKRFFVLVTALAASGLVALGYTNVLENGDSRSITNAWDAGGDMIVGDLTSSNSLFVIEGGSLTNVNGFVGKQNDASYNAATVDGIGSEWINTGSLTIGGGSNNTLTVEDSGSVVVGQDLLLQNSSTLVLDSGGSVQVAGNMDISDSTLSGTGTISFSTNDVDNVLSISGTNTVIGDNIVFKAGEGDDTVSVSDWTFTVSANTATQFDDFETLAITNGTLGGSGTLDAFEDIVIVDGTIAPDGDLVVDDDFTWSGDTVLQVSAGKSSLEITDDDGLNIDGMQVEVTIAADVDPTAPGATILTAANGLTGSFASTEFTEGFLLYDFSLTTSNNQIAVESDAIADGSIGSASAYAGVRGVRAGFNGMQSAVFVRTKQLRRNAVATDNAIAQQSAEFKANQTPEGPQGPGDDNAIFGMHFWMEQFSGQGDYDAMGGSAGFDLNNSGSTIGFDRMFGDALVAGINYTYARSDANTTGGDKVETETYWLGLYGEWVGPDEYYVDGLLALGRSDYKTVRTDTGYTGKGKFSGSDFGGHIEGGKYFHHKGWAAAPYAGLHYLWIKSDDYTEIAEQGGNETQVSGQEVASLESALGVKLRNRFDTRAGRFQTAGYAEWAYDFINDEIDSTISDGTASITTARITPGASLFNAGLGLSWICTEYLEVGIGYDGRFNEDYEEHLGSIMLDVRF